MKKIINGRKYDTDTAKIIDSYNNGQPCDDYAYFSETLYQKTTKEFFVYGHGGAASHYRGFSANGGWWRCYYSAIRTRSKKMG